MKSYKNTGRRKFKNRKIFKRNFLLPVYPGITKQEILKICNKIKNTI